MARGLDYAFDHPDLNCIRSRGYEFVGRYIGDLDPNPLKYLDAPELANLRAAGLSVVVARETTAGYMLTDDGGPHARASRAHCNALGMFGNPIFYALDVDPRALTQSWRNNVHSFLAEAAAADGGGHNVGIYGSDDALDWFMGPNCHWGWQTYAWSGGRISPNAHFRQYLNGQAVCGGTVDLNETYRPDYGQWPRPTPPEETLSAAEVAEIKAHVDDTKPFFAKSEEHAAIWVVYKSSGTKRWMATEEMLWAAWENKVFAAPSTPIAGQNPSAWIKPWPRSKVSLNTLDTVGPTPEGW